MTVAEIKELFELTSQKIAIIDAETAQIRREAEDIRKESESIRKEIEEESAREIAEIRKEAEDIRKETEDIRKEAEDIRKEAEDIRKETEDIRKESEGNRKEARKLADNDFREMRKILDRTEKNIENTSSHLGFYTESVSKISEEYFYRGLKSNITIGDMTFDTIVRNKHIDGKEYDIILENNKAVMLVSVKTNIGYSHIPRLIYDDIVKLKKSSKYKSIDKKFYVAIAGFTGADKVLESAKKDGVFLLTLSGEHQPTLVNSEISPTPY